MHNNAAMNAHASAPPSLSISPAPGERPGKRARSRTDPRPAPTRSGLFCCPASASPAARGAHRRRYHGRPWAADPPGRFPSADPRHAATARRASRASTPPASTTPAASASSPQASGARSHEVVRDGARGRRPRGPPRRGLDRQLGRRRRPADPDSPPAVLPRRLPAGPASAARAARSAWACSSCRASRRRSAQSVAHDRARARRGRHPVPGLARRAHQSRGARARRRWPRARSSARCWWAARRWQRDEDALGAGALPGPARDGAAGGGAPAARVLRLLALLPHHRLQGAAHRDPAARVLHRLPLSRSTRAPSRSSTSATPPTPCPAGRWPSRSGCWPTTARSTRCGATATR